MFVLKPSAVVHNFLSKILNTGSTSLCLVCILMLPHVFGTTFVKQTFLFLKMDLWRIEEASISHLVCILCIPEVFRRAFLRKLLSIISFSLSRFKGSSCSGWISGGPLELPSYQIKYKGSIPWCLMSFSGEKSHQ